MLAFRRPNSLLLVALSIGVFACEPHVTIVEGGEGGESGEVTGGGGGTAGMSATGGMIASGGVGGFIGVGGTGAPNGSGGSGPPASCEQLIDTSTLGCDAWDAMRDHCARGGCHNAATRAGQLDLTLDALLIARILEVPAKHVITCSGIGQCNLAAPQCDNCRMCPTGDFLLTKANFGESWMIKKMDAFDVDMPSTAPNMGCGTAMPHPPGTMNFDAERRACLTNFFRWIADNGRPCDISTGGTSGGGGGGSGGT